MDYQLAVTIFRTSTDDEITEVFRRINSYGKQLSSHERRQAGIISPFSQMIRDLASEIRGDVSNNVLLLQNMPEISINSVRTNYGYGLISEEIFWCKQGILWSSELRKSEDEEFLADIAASILLKKPFPRSREKLDELYDPDTSLYTDVENALIVYGKEELIEKIKFTISVIRETIEKYNEDLSLRSIVNPGSRNPIKTGFYAIFMAFYELMVNQTQFPDNDEKILEALKNLQSSFKPGTHYIRSDDRKKNIDKTIGLIQEYFVRKDQSILGCGRGLSMDFENSLRRSTIESSRYEFKQGLLRLSPDRKEDSDLPEKIIRTICAIANLGPESSGVLYVGVADKYDDAEKIKQLDGIEVFEINGHYVVGIDREADVLGIRVDDYSSKILGFIRNSQLSENLKTNILNHIDVFQYKGLHIVRIFIPPQKYLSYVGDKAYIREGTETIEVNGRKLVALSDTFK
jgi:hypothetical protein